MHEHFHANSASAGKRTAGARQKVRRQKTYRRLFECLIASCAVTENGVLRVLSLPGYARRMPPGFPAVRDKLALACGDVDHEFWSCDISLRDTTVLNWSHIMGHNQITDAYLLALAVRHGGALATFDHHVARSPVHGATPKDLRLL